MILMEKNGNKSLTEKISVIIPSCNRSSYLSRAVKSVINQNYDNVEIIIINDASTDDTKEMVASFKYKNIVYIENKVRMGANYCRNMGLKKASGEFISFLDDDDYFSEIDKIEQQLNIFKSNKKIVFVGCGYFDKSINRGRYPKVRGKIDKFLLLSFSNIETSTILFKKSVIDQVGYLDEKLPSEQNHDFFYRISKIGEFDYVPKIMVIKDMPDIQISSNSIKKLRGYIIYHKKHISDIQNLGIKKFLYAMLKFVSVSIILLISIFIRNNLNILKIIDEKLIN